MRKLDEKQIIERDALELCLECNTLRGEFLGWRNLCGCEARAVSGPRPRCGDLEENVHLCDCCLTDVAAGCSKWSSFYCRDCSAGIRSFKMRVGAVVPLGRHSMMNGTSVTAEALASDLAASAFYDQLRAGFASINKLFETTQLRVRARAIELDLDGTAISFASWRMLNHEAGHHGRKVFLDFLIAVTGIEHAGSDFAADLWDGRHERR